MAQTQVIAKVSELSGQVFVRDGAGNMRRLKLGDVIREGESVVAADGAKVVLALADGREMTVRPGETVRLDAEVAAAVKPDAADSAVVNDQQGFQKIAKALQSGGDLDALLEEEAPAAGLVGQGGNEGHTFVELLRIVETVDPLAFQFGTNRGRPIETIDAAPVTLAATDEPGQVLFARNDANAVSELVDSAAVSKVSGNVLAAGAATDVADSGLPGAVLTVTEVRFGASVAAPGSIIALVHGTLVVAADGSYTYTLDNADPVVNALNVGNQLAEQVTYTISDGLGHTAQASLTLTINGANDTPTATPTVTAIVMPEDGSVVVPLSGSDQDSTIDFVTVTTLPTDGVLLKPDGTPVVAGQPIPVDPVSHQALLTFVPDANFSGTVTFAFSVTDTGGLTSAPATQQIDVTPVNDPPVAVVTPASGDEDTPISVSLTGTDLDGTLQHVTVTTLPPVTQGVLYLADGTTPVTANTPLSPSDAASLIFKPAADFNGTVNIPFTVTDNNNATSAPASTPITVNPVNDPPVAIVTPASGDEDTPISVSLTGTDLDGTIQYLTVTTLPPVTQGVLYLADGTTPVVAGTPLSPAAAAGLIFQPAPDFNGPVNIPFTVTDNSNATSALAVTPITVNPLSDPTTITGDTSGSGTEDAATPITGTLGATDPDGLTDGTVFSVTTNGGHGTASIDPATGAWTYTPVADYNGPDSFTVTITDDLGNTSSQLISLTINPEIDIAANSVTTDEDTAITIDVLANDDFEGTPTVSAVGTAAHGTVLINPDNTVTYTPAANYNGPDSFTYTVTSPTGVTETATVSVTVTPINDAPVAGDDIASTEINKPVAVDVKANDNDPDNANSELTVSNPVVDPTKGTVVVNPDGTLTFTPANNVTGPISITYTLTDPSGLTDTATITVNVGSNTPPEGADKSFTFNEDQSQAFSAADFGFTDADLGQTLQAVRLDNLPATGSLTLNGAAVVAGQIIAAGDLGELRYTPVPNGNGTPYASFSFSVQDSAGTFDTAPNTITLNVTPVNDLPYSNPTTVNISEDQTHVLVGGDFDMSDIDGTVVSVHIGSSSGGVLQQLVGGVWTTLTIPAGVGIDVAKSVIDAGELRFAPVPDLNGNAVAGISYKPVDDLGGTRAVFTQIAFHIAAVVDIAANSVTTDEDTAITIDVLANDNFEGTPTVSAVGTAAHGTVLINPDNTVTYTPAANYNGPDSFTYTVTSPTGVTETATVSITVAPTSDPTTITGDTSGSGTEDAATPITGTLGATDPDGLTDGTVFSVTTDGGHGTASIDPATGAWTYTPVADYNGPDSFTVTITDDLGNTSSQLISLTVNPEIDIAANSVTTDEDTAITIDVLANDHFEGTPTVSALGTAAHGTVVINADHTVTYTPAANYNGSDSFTYTVTSPAGVTETATVSITVNPTNDPTAITGDTSGSGTEDVATPITGTLSATDPDGLTDGTVFSVTTNGAHGTASIDPVTGAWTYTPVADYNGSDSFTVTITDDAGNATTQVISLTVAAVADIVGDNLSTSEDTAVTILASSLLANDNFEGTPTVSAVGSAAHGTVSLVGGNITYTPNANYNGSDSFTYTVTSPAGVTETATVSITVTPTNDLTTITGDTSGSGTEDAATPITGTLSATDPDGLADGTVFSVTTNGAHGTASIDPVTGAWTYTPVADYNGPDSFTVTITDDLGNTSTQLISLTVNPEIDIAANSVTTDEDTAITIDVLANDDFEGTPTVSAVGTAAHGTVVINADNTVTYTPAANYNGPDSFTYTVTSPAGVTETATVNITVTPVNDPPVAVITPASGYEDTPISVSLTGTDLDGTLQHVTVTTLPPVTQGVLYLADGITPVTANTPLSPSDAASLIFKPAADFNGTVNIPFTVTDNNNATSAPASTPITVNPVNDPPVAVVTPASGDEDTPISVSLTGTDLDGTIQYLTVTTLPPVTQGVLYLADGTTPVTANTPLSPSDAASLIFKPATDFNGTVNFPFTVTDNGNATSALAVTPITVTPTNDPTTITGDTSGSGTEDAATPITGTLAATDPDGLTDGTVFSVTTNGAHGTASIDPVTGAWTYTPVADYNGPDSFTVTITDDLGKTSSQLISLTINPEIDIAANSVTTDEDTAITIDVLANDDFEGTPTVSAVGTAAHGTVVINADNTVTYTPAANYNGPDSFTYTVTSPAGVTETATVNITVTPVNDPPVAVITPASGDEDTPISVSLTGTDLDGTLQHVTVTTLPPVTQGVLYLADGITPVTANTPLSPSDAASLIFKPAADFNGTVNIPFTVTDNNNATSAPAATPITVNPVVDPAISIDDVTVNEAAGTMTFTVTLDQPTTATVTVNYATAPGGAVSPDDYVAGTGTLTFTPGVVTQVVTVKINNDGSYEGAETFNVNLSAAANATIAHGQGIGTILDNGSGAGGSDDDRPSLSVSSPTVAEDGGYAVFTLSLSNASAIPTTVSLALGNGSASSPADYTNALEISTDGGVNWTAASSATFAPNVTSVLARTPIIDDLLAEASENFTLTATTTAGVTANPSAIGTASITDNDTPAFSIDNVTVNEGAGTITFTVTLSNPSASATSVSYATAPDSATTPADYAAGLNGLSGTLNFAAGVTSQTITLNIANDTVYEGAESFNVTLSGATGGAVINDALGLGTILDDGNGAGGSNDDRPQVGSISSPTVVEGGNLDFAVTLTTTSTTPTIVTLTPASGSATLGTDTSPLQVSFDGGLNWAPVVGGTVSVPAGNTGFTVRVPTVNDNISEPSETITLGAATAQNAAPVVGTGTITDNDGTPSLVITGPALVNEAAGTLTYTVTLSNPSSSTVTVGYNTANGSATAGSDYVASSGTLSFAPGETVKTFTVDISNDTTYEGNENYTVNLSAPSNATVATGTVSTTIADDGNGQGGSNDDRPQVGSISSPTVVEGGNLDFAVTLTHPSTTPTVVTLTPASGSATLGTDTSPLQVSFDGGLNWAPVVGSTVSVPANTVGFTVRVPTVNDNISEPSESMTLGAATAQNAAPVVGTGTITDNDGTPTIIRVDDPVDAGINSVTVPEGNDAVFTVSLSNPSSTTTTYSLNLASGSATLGADFTNSLTFSDGVTYNSSTGQITVPAGVTSFTVAVPTINDKLDESNETFSLSVGGVVGNATIIDNDSSPVAVVDTNSMYEDAGSVTGNVLGNDTDADGDALSVTQFVFGGTTYAAGTTAIVSGLGTLTVGTDGQYSFTPATHYSGTPAITYTVSDGPNSSSAALNITVIAVQDAPILVIGTSTVVGGSTNNNPLPVSTGLKLAFYDALENVLSDADAANTLNLEAAVETVSPTSTTNVTNVGVAQANFGTGDAYRYTGFMYMEAGHSYTFSGYRDDTIQMKIGGATVLSSGFNNWTNYSETFTPLVSGYYSYELNVYNGDSIGELTAFVAVDGGSALALNTSNYLLYASSTDLTSSGTVLGAFVTNGDGGYYPVDIVGADNAWISLGSVSASLVDADSSEVLSVLISSIPVGASLTDGTHIFTATAGNTSVDVTDWDQSALQFKSLSGYTGVIDLTVTATATETSNGASASSTGIIEVTVADASAPTLYVPETMVVVSQGTGSTYRTVSLPIVAGLTDSSEILTISVAGLPTGAVLSDGTHSFTASMGDSTADVSSWNLSNLTIALATNYSASGTALTVTATSTAYGDVNGVPTPLDSASTSHDIVLISDYTTTTVTGTSSANTLTGTAADNYIDGAAGNDNISGLDGNDLILGGTGNDIISGGNGSDVLYGNDGTDTITGGAGSDRIIGGTGNDTLSGNAGSAADSTTDVFQWLLNDQGTVATPAVDTITDFGTAAASAGGDILDLRDLLTGSASTPAELDNYLHFQVVGGTTTIFVSTSGAFANDNAVNTTTGSLPANVSSSDVQQIVLTGADIVGGNTTDQAVILDLLNKGKLMVDS